MTTDVQLMDISCAGSCWINPMTRHAFGPRLKSAKTEIMRNKGWLSHTPKRFQNEILARSSFCEFKAGHQIYNVGDPPGGMYGLIDGGLAIAVANGERVFDFAHFASAGSWFGEASAFTDMPRRVGLRCTRQSSLLHLSQVEIKAVTHEESKIMAMARSDCSRPSGHGCRCSRRSHEQRSKAPMPWNPLALGRPASPRKY